MGVMALFFANYTNYSFFAKNSTKTAIQTHFSSITQALLHCKSISGEFPTANNTLVSALECPADPPYSIDGYGGFFTPKAPRGFSEYRAFDDGGAFYIQTSIDASNTYAQVLQDLEQNYSDNQYDTFLQDSKQVARYYISR